MDQILQRLQLHDASALPTNTCMQVDLGFVKGKPAAATGLDARQWYGSGTTVHMFQYTVHHGMAGQETPGHTFSDAIWPEGIVPFAPPSLLQSDNRTHLPADSVRVQLHWANG